MKQYSVYQDGIGNEEFATLSEAKHYIYGVIKDIFSITEYNDKNDSETAYDVLPGYIRLIKQKD